MSVFKLPDWTKRLPDDACLSAKEMSCILGYKNTATSVIINKKLGFSDDDSSIKVRVGTSYNKRRAWRIGDLRLIEGKEI